jgi:transposase-like protein
MKTYPEDAIELMNMFPSEEACLDYLATIRWPHGYQCLRCSDKSTLKLGRGLYRCQSCKYEGLVIVDTLFQGTHKPIQLWFQAILYIVSQKKPGKRGRRAEGKTLVLIAAEETQWGIRRIRMAPISDASGDILEKTIQQMVEIGSTIRTDGWAGYNGLSKLGYTHLPMLNHNVKDEDLIEQAHLVASLFKRWLIGTLHGAINHKNLLYYLDEFTFRFNRRTSNSRGKLFYRLIQQALEMDPVPAKLLAAVDS